MYHSRIHLYDEAVRFDVVIDHAGGDAHDEGYWGAHVLFEGAGEDGNDHVLPSEGEDEGQEGFNGISQDCLGLRDKYDFFLE